MSTINIHEAKTHLSRLVDQAAAGEEIIIAKAGKPLARLVPYQPVKRPSRKLGMFNGTLNIPDDFDAPLHEDELRLFEGR
jgi:prevent-host-death family protein